MVHLAWLLAAALGAPAAPSTGGGEAPGAAAPEVAAPGRWRLFLRDGRVLRGEIVDRDAETLTVAVDGSGERVRFQESLVRRLEGPPLPPRCAAADGRELTVRLRKGGEVAGRLLRRCEGVLVLAGPGGEAISVADDEVHTVLGPRGTGVGVVPTAPRPAEAPRGSDVLATRSLATRTALAPSSGAVTVSNAALHVSVEADVLEHLTLAVGLTPPVLYAEPIGANYTLEASAAAGLGPVHGRAGVVAAGTTKRGLRTAFLFGAVTLGDADRQLSVYAGPPLPGAGRAGDFGDRIAAVGATWRLSSWLALVGEGWRSLDGRDLAGGGALRLLRAPFALEVGLFVVPDGRALPWVSLAWRLRGGP